jgi:hypothetical protein
MSMPPTLEANPYQAMWAYSNYIHVSSVEEHLTTCDNGVATIYEQKCVFGPSDQNPMLAKLKYVRWVEEILELKYMVLNIIVL